MRQRCISWLMVFGLMISSVACQKPNDNKAKKGKSKATSGTPAGQGIPISKEELDKRKKFGLKACPAFCKKAGKLCADFFKRKKRSLPYEPCVADCVKNFIRQPSYYSMSFGCVVVAKTCDEVRNCHKCAKTKCRAVIRRTKKAATQPSKRRSVRATRKDNKAPSASRKATPAPSPRTR